MRKSVVPEIALLLASVPVAYASLLVGGFIGGFFPSVSGLTLMEVKLGDLLSSIIWIVGVFMGSVWTVTALLKGLHDKSPLWLLSALMFGALMCGFIGVTAAGYSLAPWHWDTATVVALACTWVVYLGASLLEQSGYT